MLEELKKLVCSAKLDLVEKGVVIYTQDNGKYAPDVIADLQNCDFEMIKQFNKICEENNIPWVLLFGSAIGAVRHHGFIPWDDDVDIGMMREDYAKLKKVFQENGNNIDSLMCIDASDGIAYHDKIFPRIYKKGTTFETKKFHNSMEFQGEEKTPIWIDIFLYDYADSKEQAEAKIDKAFNLHRRYVWCKYDMHLTKEAGLKTNFKTLLKMVYHAYAKRRWSPEKVVQEYQNLVGAHETKEYIITYDPWMKKEVKASFMKYSDCFPEQRVDFRGVQLPIFKDYDQYLKNTYGDYMQLPPENDRVNHPPYILDLNDGRGDRIIKD